MAVSTHRIVQPPAQSILEYLYYSQKETPYLLAVTLPNSSIGNH